MAGGDGDYLPIVKVAPLYPRRALSPWHRGRMSGALHGDVTTGTVRDVEVVAEVSAPTSLFIGRPSRLPARFKYKPRVVDGVAIEVRGVLNRFYFEREMAQEAEQ